MSHTHTHTHLWGLEAFAQPHAFYRFACLAGPFAPPANPVPLSLSLSLSLSPLLLTAAPHIFIVRLPPPQAYGPAAAAGASTDTARAVLGVPDGPSAKSM